MVGLKVQNNKAKKAAVPSPSLVCRPGGYGSWRMREGQRARAVKAPKAAAPIEESAYIVGEGDVRGFSSNEVLPALVAHLLFIQRNLDTASLPILHILDRPEAAWHRRFSGASANETPAMHTGIWALQGPAAHTVRVNHWLIAALDKWPLKHRVPVHLHLEAPRMYLNVHVASFDALRYWQADGNF